MISPLLKTLHMSFEYYHTDNAEHSGLVIFKQHIFLSSLFSSSAEPTLFSDHETTWVVLDVSPYKTCVHLCVCVYIHKRTLL